MQVVTTVGLDIAKSVFQVHGVDAAGQVVIRRQLKRHYVLAFFEKLPACLVGIEACASSHQSRVLLLHVILHGAHAAAASGRVQQNSVPSTQMRCMMTASRRASATIAFFMPRCLAIFIAQALSHDHLLVRSATRASACAPTGATIPNSAR